MPSAVYTLLAIIAFAAFLGWWLRSTVLGRGMAVPLRTMFTKPVTYQYPEERKEPADRFHGRHQLNLYPDGLEKCIGCELCAWACPADAIYVQGEDNTPAERFSPGERYAVDYQINYNRCIFCGLCIEACPTRALTMTQDYELAERTRDGLIYTKDMLMASLPSGASPAPHTEREVAERGLNYYGGDAVTPPLLGGDVFAQASVAPSQRSSAVVPTGAWAGAPITADDVDGESS